MRRLSRQLLAAAATIGLAAHGLSYGGNAWVGKPYSGSISTHFTGCGQTLSGTVNLSLSYTAPCTCTVSVAGQGDEVLTHNGDTLTTRYKLTGVMLSGGGDASWVDSTTFRTKAYTLVGDSAGVMTLWVEGTSASNRANEAGAYSASLTLTLAW